MLHFQALIAQSAFAIDRHWFIIAQSRRTCFMQFVQRLSSNRMTDYPRCEFERQSQRDRDASRFCPAQVRKLRRSAQGV